MGWVGRTLAVKGLKHLGIKLLYAEQEVCSLMV